MELIELIATLIGASSSVAVIVFMVWSWRRMREAFLLVKAIEEIVKNAEGLVKIFEIPKHDEKSSGRV